jgi:serine/threonine protein phosphatase PrpC
MTRPSRDVLASRRTQAGQCELLVDMAVANGSEDNATVVIANYQVADIPADEATNDLDDQE